MRQTERTAGFTLIEVSLAIVVGMTLLAGAVALFQQSKTSAQNSAAREKVNSLFMLVEELEVRSFELPRLEALKTAWKSRRTTDYNVSPWGGALSDPETRFIDGNEFVGDDVEIGHGANGTPHITSAADRGRLYYFRRDPAAVASRSLWLDELSVYGPADPASVFRMTGFGVACLGPDGQQWFFVAGHGKTNAPGTGR